MSQHPRGRIARTLGDIQRVLNELGQPEPGLRRVFRGQTRAYLDRTTRRHSITPGLRRRNLRMYDPGWLVTVTHGLAQLKREWDDASDAQLPDGAVDYSVPLAWAPVLLQHYGADSFFIDVTSRLETALWFCFHAWESQYVMLSLYDGAEVHERRLRTAWYTPLPVGPHHPIVYVFDLPEWDGVIVPGSGVVMDILSYNLGSLLRKVAPRLAAQEGLIINADPAVNGDDVGQFLRASVALDPEFDRSSVPGLQRTTEELFPPPDEDRMYRWLLQLPARVTFNPTRLEHPLDIPLYLPASPGGGGPQPWLDKLPSVTRHVLPLILHAELASRDAAEVSQLATDRGAPHAFSEALPILIASVISLPLPSPEHLRDKHLDTWIPSALPLGITDELGRRRTTNVFFEQSPLDFVEFGSGRYRNVPRGIWLVREHPDYALRLFWPEETGLEPLEARFRAESITGDFELTRLELIADDKPIRREVRHRLGLVARKALYVTLMLLRDLSPGWKPPPRHGYVIGRKIDGAMYLVKMPSSLLIPQRARLHRIAHGRYWEPRGLDNGPYYSGFIEEVYELPSDPTEARSALRRFLFDVHDHWYVALAGPALAGLEARAYAWHDVVTTVDHCLSLIGGQRQFETTVLELRLSAAVAHEAMGHRDAKPELEAILRIAETRAEQDDKLSEIAQKARALLRICCRRPDLKPRS